MRLWTLPEWHHYQSPVKGDLNGQPVMVSVGPAVFSHCGSRALVVLPNSLHLACTLFCLLVHVSCQFGQNVFCIFDTDMMIVPAGCVGSNFLIIVSLNVASHFKITITRVSQIHLLKILLMDHLLESYYGTKNSPQVK